MLAVVWKASLSFQIACRWNGDQGCKIGRRVIYLMFCAQNLLRQGT